MSEQKISTCLWLDHRIDEAADFYISVFGGRILGRTVYPEGAPMPQGTTLTVTFRIADQELTILNGGPHFQYTEAVSIFVRCDDQAEIDRYWSALTADGGAEIQCGWLKDKYGLRWQIAPTAFMRMLQDEDGARAGRAMQAMMGMKKLDIAALERAYRG
jgi:predicted 3-demethylubiquinone-9 3-methyltransferase (glyoxalase superfamily)